MACDALDRLREERERVLGLGLLRHGDIETRAAARAKKRPG
jgi:hypothetical protein